MTDYLVVTTKPWNVAAFERCSPRLPGRWSLITEAGELTPERISEIGPEFAFFPHWSEIVPQAVLDSVTCVGFHMSDLPFGRGGSPLQNLISHGHRDTMLSAIRLVPELDGGPIYLKRPLSLAGRAQDIFERQAELVYDMIEEIIAAKPVPRPQEGEVTEFSRRSPDQSRLPETGELSQLYDHIRMLDAETYPLAVLDHGEFRLEFSEAELKDGGLTARVAFRRGGDTKEG
jgi:methionyl-tRNA formyltransferase